MAIPFFDKCIEWPVPLCPITCVGDQREAIGRHLRFEGRPCANPGKDRAIATTPTTDVGARTVPARFSENAAPGERLASLDVLRGLTILVMIYPDTAGEPLRVPEPRSIWSAEK